MLGTHVFWGYIMLWEKKETNVYRSKYICTNDLRESDGLLKPVK